MQGFYDPAKVKGSLSIDRCTFLILSPSLSLWTEDKSEYEVNKYRIGKMMTLVKKVLKMSLTRIFHRGSLQNFSYIIFARFRKLISNLAQ